MEKGISKSAVKIKLGSIEICRRHLQKLAAIIYISILLIMAHIFLFLTPFLLIYLNNSGRLLFLLYLIYIYFDNTKYISAINGNGWMFIRNNIYTAHLRDYFPVDLVKTADLEPNRNYLLVNFPHGIVCTGITHNMAIDIGKWLHLYPGVRPKIATLNFFFYAPVIREFFRWWGLISCSQETLKYYLSKSNDPQHEDNQDGFTSNAVALVVGGVQELLDSRPGLYLLTLKNRKGFVKIAIKTGCPIVPTFSFGEVDIFNQVESSPDSTFRKIQLLMKKLTKVSPAIIFGRGLVPHSLGILPNRKRIVQVVGAPIEVVKMSNPSPEYIDEVHLKVIDNLNELFEKHKYEYIENADKIKLIIN